MVWAGLELVKSVSSSRTGLSDPLDFLIVQLSMAEKVDGGGCFLSDIELSSDLYLKPSLRVNSTYPS